MHVIRDFLDKKVVDRNGRELGRVDSVIVETGNGGAIRITAIELGPAVLARRVHPVVGRCVTALEHVCGIDRAPLRIPLSDVLDINDRVKVDMVAGDTTASIVDRRLRALLRRIPGGA
jgi:sporulation protein YlmC with PRC-barrel domain